MKIYKNIAKNDYFSNKILIFIGNLRDQRAFKSVLFAKMLYFRNGQMRHIGTAQPDHPFEIEMPVPDLLRTAFKVLIREELISGNGLI